MVVLDNPPQFIIDPKDMDLFMLFKESADKGMDESNFPQLYDMLQYKGKLIRFAHDHEHHRVYVDFPTKSEYKDIFREVVNIEEN